MTASYNLSQLGSNYLQGGTGSVARTTASKLQESVSVLDFGADPTGVIDSTTAIQAAITACQTSGASLYIPAGTYKTTSTLTISARLRIYGDGNRRSIISLNTASTSVYAITISIPDNSSIIGMDLGGIGIIGNAGSAVGCGIYIATTATNSAVSQSIFHDMYITNVTTGVQLYGIIYMCTFRNITVTGNVTTYGWYSPNPLGQTLYNSFTDLEVTNTGAGAYAYYMNAVACQFRNLTCDGCCYFAGAYTHVQGLAVEGIAGTTTPSTYCIQTNQIFSLSDVDIINVPNSKCTYGIDLQGPNCNLSSVRFADAGAGNQPNNPINLHAGNVGTISNVLMDRAPTNLLESYLSDAILNNFVISGCNTITNRGLTYQQGVWTPTFPTNWTTSPTIISAQYTKVGRQVTVTMYGNNGVSTAGAIIAGLPFTSNSTQAAGAYGGCTDTTKVITGSVVINSTQIQNIPALTLTSQYWQITATYFT
jgi:hypothetical protein